MVVQDYLQICQDTNERLREDNLWMISSGILVLGMNAAFGLLEAGSVRSRNALNILMKNISDMTLGGVVWWLCGYKLAFPEKDGGWPHSVYDEAFWFFQWTFAATAATIDSGAIAERVNFLSYVLLSLVTTGLIYPVAVSWVWARDGFLVEKGFQDFAGGAVVHMLGACSALICCLVLGPRVGRFQDYQPKFSFIVKYICKRSSDPDYYMMPAGQGRIIAVTDPVSLVWGVFFLWIGWYGFNTGGVSDVEYGGTFVIGRVIVNTTLGALGGAAANFILMLVLNHGSVYAEGFALGVLSGLVSITAGCIWYGNGDSFLIGVLGACLAEAARWACAYIHIDDVVTAIPIHGFPGFFGTMCIAFFAQPYPCHPGGPVGLFYASEGDQMNEAWRLLWVQLYGCFIVAAWTMSTTFLTLVVINQIPYMALRVPRAMELKGLDQEEHDMSHDVDDFQDTVKQFLANLAKPSDEDYETRMQNASSEALKCLSFAHHMQEFAHDRVARKSDTTLVVQEILVLGLLSEELKTKPCCASTFTPGHKMHVTIEVVSAIRLENCYQRDYNYFAPRRANFSKCDAPKKEVHFHGSHIFEDFYIPPGSEDTTLVCFTLHLLGVAVGLAHMPFLNAEWVPIRAKGMQGVEATMTVAIQLMSEEHRNLHPDGVEIRARLLCPFSTGERVHPSTLLRVESLDKSSRGVMHHTSSMSVAEIISRQSASGGPPKKSSTIARLVRGATLKAQANDTEDDEEEFADALESSMPTGAVTNALLPAEAAHNPLGEDFNKLFDEVQWLKTEVCRLNWVLHSVTPLNPAPGEISYSPIASTSE